MKSIKRNKFLIPTHRQWRSWSLPSKLTAIGTLVGVVSLLIGLGSISSGLLNNKTNFILYKGNIAALDSGGGGRQEELNLIFLLLENEEKNLKLNLSMDHEQASFLEEPKIDGTSKVYQLPLSGIPIENWLMDVLIRVDPNDDFYFGIGAANHAELKGSFKIIGCTQTGTGWFSCELQALQIDDS